MTSQDPHPGLKFEFQRHFYASLCPPSQQVEVEFSDPRRGKRLLAKAAFEPDQVVLRERKWVASQNLDDKVEHLLVCGHCLKSLETVLENCLRVRKKLSSQQPGAKKERLYPLSSSDFPHFEQIGAPTKLPCPGKAQFPTHPCQEVYCSEACQQAAWRDSHAILCPQATKFTKYNDPIEEYYTQDWTQAGINYSDTFVVAFAVIAQVMCGVKVRHETPRQAWLPFSYFVSAPWEEMTFEYLLTTEDMEPEEGSSEVSKADLVSRAICLLRRVHAATPFPMNGNGAGGGGGSGGSGGSSNFCDVEFLFEPAFFSRLLGMVLLNGQERTPSSPFALYRSQILSPYSNDDPLIQTLFTRICGRSSSVKDRDLLNYSSMGQGIYLVGANMNHSCDPNVTVSYSEANNEELVVTAKRRIQAGEEICISYIDESMAWKTRQEHLLQHYLFQCQCSLCLQEQQEQEQEQEQQKQQKQQQQPPLVGSSSSSAAQGGGAGNGMVGIIEFK